MYLKEKQYKIAMILLCPVQGPWASSFYFIYIFYENLGTGKDTILCNIRYRMFNKDIIAFEKINKNMIIQFSGKC